jgi:hypothetical protein
METGSATRELPSRKVYRLSQRERLGVRFAAGFLVLLAVAAPFLIFWFFLSSVGYLADTAIFATIALVVVFLLMAWVVYRTAENTYIVVTSEGLEYHNGGHSLYTTWDNVERIGVMPWGATQYGHNMAEGLILRRPATRRGTILLGGQTFRHSYRFIPLTQLAGWWWRDTELGQDIKRYLPSLYPGGQSSDTGFYH